MSFKYLRTLNRPRPFGKPLKFQEFRQRYLIFISLYLGVGILPALAWIQLGRSFEAIYVEVFGYCALIGVTILSLNKIFSLYEGRLQCIFPQLKKCSRRELAKFRLLLEISSAVPIFNLSILAALFLRKKPVKKTPYFLSHTTQCTYMVASVALIPLFPLFLLAVGSNSVPELPRNLSFWASTPHISFVSSLHRDVEDTLEWGKTSRNQIAQEKLSHEETNKLLLKKIQSKEIKTSLIAPQILSSVSIAAHHLSNQNNRSLSSDAKELTEKYFIYENSADILKNWQPSFFYAYNPVSLISPLNNFELFINSIVIRSGHADQKKKFHQNLTANLERLQTEASKQATAIDLRVKIKKLKNEVGQRHN